MTMSEAPQPHSRARWPKPRTFGLWGVGLFGVATAATFAVAGTSSLRNGGPTPEERRLLASLEKSLPNTKIAAVSCDGSSAPPGFCEFVAGRNVFYASKDGRYVFLGQVLDIKAKVDLTDRRAKELASVATVEGYVTQKGKSGVRGQVVERSGGLTARAAIAGTLQGLGTTLSQNLARSQSGLNAVAGPGGVLASEKLSGGELAQGAIGGGVSNAASMLAEYYIKRAEQYQPVIEMPTGITVEIVFLSGFQIRGPQ